MEKEKKLQIIRAAHKRFVKHGLNKTTLDEVARDLRMGKATLYHYFKSKEDLYYNTLKYDVGQYLSEIKTVLENQEMSIKERLENILNIKIYLQAKYKLIYDLLIHIIREKEFPQEKEIAQDLLASETRIFSEYLSSGNKSGYPVEQLAAFISRQSWLGSFAPRLVLNEEAGAPEMDNKFILHLLDESV